MLRIAKSLACVGRQSEFAAVRSTTSYFARSFASEDKKEEEEEEQWTADTQGISAFLNIDLGAEKPKNYGRAWHIDELRSKSNDDLHKLWFVLLKERNILSSEKRFFKTEGRTWPGYLQMTKVRQSMARLKTVVRERELAEVSQQQ